MPLSAKDWLLLVVAEAQGEPIEPVHVQKVLFLVGEELSDFTNKHYYIFEPFRYGPYCKEVPVDLEALNLEGSVVSTPFYYDADKDPALKHAATEEGIALAASKYVMLSEEAKFFVSEVVGWARSTDFVSICRSIYYRYPEMAEKSILVDKTPVRDFRMPTLKSATKMMHFCNEAVRKADCGEYEFVQHNLFR